MMNLPEQNNLYNKTMASVFVAAFIYVLISALGHSQTTAASLAMFGSFVSIVWLLS